MDSANEKRGTIIGINGNLITVEFQGDVRQNEVGYAVLDEKRLKSEVVRLKGNKADLQVFEDTFGLKAGDAVEFTGDLLSVELGPGLLGQVYDGLQNPLYKLAEEAGYFLPRGRYITALPEDVSWDFQPIVKTGDMVRAGDAVGVVQEGIFNHKIMVPFQMQGRYQITEISQAGAYAVNEQISVIRSKRGEEIPLSMVFEWPVKRPVTIYDERLDPSEPLLTKIRIIDSLFPVAKGGTYCIPGPFGAGKTVLQQITSRNAEVDVVIIAACGERAGEVVETIREFPKIEDPYTGKSLMERTIIVCNTSSMPVASREASVYTAVAMGEYYRQMGLNVLILPDSTSRWAQAMRERSGRLEEIPGEEAFPAYLESVIANFYERAGLVKLRDGITGSITIGGTVSPAGGNFEEPVTQATLKVVGAFEGLSRERSDARRYPAIDPLESWTKYNGIIDTQSRHAMISLLTRANEIDQMMKVVGEEGTSLEDYMFYLKGEFFDSVYLQQNAFHPVDGATSKERQIKVFSLIERIVTSSFEFKDRDEAREFFQDLRLAFLDYNVSEWESDGFVENENRIQAMLEKHIREEPEIGLVRKRQSLIESDMDATFSRSRHAATLKQGRFTTVSMEDEEDI
ncbi:MAG: V-type ATP synthase subunit A [Thermodesulfobacteriota bacterium]|nr:V-type ATP synthase subunit A [Thermodesulfobacteriota bacterium]